MSRYIPPHLRQKPVEQTVPEMKKMLDQLKTCADKLSEYDIDLNDINEFKCIHPNIWVKGEFIAKGNAGQVFQACCVNQNTQTIHSRSKECKFVVKIIEHKIRAGYELITQEVIQKEILLQQAFNKHNLTTPIIEAFYCKSTNTSYIITKPKQSTLYQLCDGLASIHNYKFVTQTSLEYLDLIVMLLQRAIDSIVLANKYGLYHHDTHLHNFMTDVDVDDVVEEVNQAVQTLQFIDFGYSLQAQPNDYDLSEYDMSLFISSIMELPFARLVYPKLKLYHFQAHFDEFYS